LIVILETIFEQVKQRCVLSFQNNTSIKSKGVYFLYKTTVLLLQTVFSPLNKSS